MSWRPFLFFWVAILLLPFAWVTNAEVRFESSGLWRRASGIPAGQQVFSFQTSYQRFQDYFAADGRLQPLGQQYSRSLTWKDILRNENSVGQKDLRDYMQGQGVRETDMAAVSRYDIEREETRFNIGWAYGLMDRWMIGFRVPLTYRTTRVRQSVDISERFVDGPGLRAERTGVRLSHDQMRARVRALAEQQLEQSGYDRIPDQRRSWDWGDASLMSQETVWKGYNWTWGLQQEVRFPTAQNPSVDDYVKTSTDEGQTDIGMSSRWDYRHRSWLLGVGMGYVAQLPDSVRMHVPDSSSQGSATGGRAVEPTVARDLGDWFWASADAEIAVHRRVSLNVEHALLSKGRDSYGAGASDGISFDSYGDNTDQQLQESKLGFVYRIGSTKSRGGIMSRWTAAIDYTYPWIGKNSIEASRTSFEFINYF